MNFFEIYLKNNYILVTFFQIITVLSQINAEIESDTNYERRSLRYYHQAY
jgi:hypothetical protein